jgi:glycosyltransferase involved in cell wall biosynthesis
MRYQADALRSLGFELTTVVGREEGVVFDDAPAVKYRWSGGRPLRIINHYATFWRVIGAHCSAEDYDVIYIRHPGANPALLGFLGWMKNRRPEVRIVLEVATFPFSSQAESISQKMVVAADQALSGLLRRFVDYVVTVCGQTEIYGIPCVRTSNGIDVDAVPMRRARAFDPQAPRFLGVASLARYQGYDRVLHGLRHALDRNPNLKPHVSFAGDGPAAAELKELCRTLDLDDYVTFHGMMIGEELDRLFDDSDVAIGTLAIHRSGLQGASSLKAREYCARGIPFLLAGEDESFRESFPFALRMSRGDDPIDLAEVVVDLVNLLEKVDKPAEKMRAYAAETLSWKTRLAEIMQIALSP